MHSLKNEIVSKIPKIIWQTAKAPNNLHPNAKRSIASFLQKNPNYQWYIMNDEQCRQFIQDHFSQEFYNMYISLPIGVMKADIWRMAVIYVYGGVYVDTDCECIVPLDSWIDPNDDLIVFEEHYEGSYGNFVIIASPKHPAILNGLEHAINTYNSEHYLTKGCNTPVQNFGAHSYYAGVLNYLKTNSNIRILKYNDNRISHHLNANSYIVHDAASIKWDNYDSWRTHESRLK